MWPTLSSGVLREPEWGWDSLCRVRKEGRVWVRSNDCRYVKPTALTWTLADIQGAGRTRQATLQGRLMSITSGAPAPDAPLIFQSHLTAKQALRAICCQPPHATPRAAQVGECVAQGWHRVVIIGSAPRPPWSLSKCCLTGEPECKNLFQQNRSFCVELS